MTAYLFSGQGSQFEGMGRDLARMSDLARRVFEEGSECLGYDVLALDAGQLAMTRYAQPAICVCSLASWAAYRDLEGISGNAVFAGFSLGEYSALIASGRLTMSDVLQLVGIRSRLMQESCDTVPGAMAAVLGMSPDAIQACLTVTGLADTVYIANFNAPQQSVIAGPADQVAQASGYLVEAGARRVAQLAVSGAFHTRYMADAARELKAEFRSLELAGTGTGTVFSNFYAAPLLPALQLESDPSFATYLERHMTSPVRWVEEILEIKKTGTESFVEFGPGKVLAGLVGKILPGTDVRSADHLFTAGLS